MTARITAGRENQQPVPCSEPVITLCSASLLNWHAGYHSELTMETCASSLSTVRLTQDSWENSSCDTCVYATVCPWKVPESRELLMQCVLPCEAGFLINWHITVSLIKMQSPLHDLYPLFTWGLSSLPCLDHYECSIVHTDLSLN